MKLKLWRENIKVKDNSNIMEITPHIHTLPQVIYINWLGYE